MSLSINTLNYKNSIMKNPDKIKAIPDDKMIELIMNSFSLQEILDKLEIKRDQRCKNLIKDFAIKHNLS